jgi:hypothetical protein
VSLYVIYLICITIFVFFYIAMGFSPICVEHSTLSEGNILLSSGGNPLPPTGGGNGNPLPPTGGGGGPQHPTGGPLPHTLGPRQSDFPESNLFHSYDIEPNRHAGLRSVYNKLKQLDISMLNTSPNRSLTMNSPRLIDLEFTTADRSIMKGHVEDVCPQHSGKFYVNKKLGYSVRGYITSEILNLFKPD